MSEPHSRDPVALLLVGGAALLAVVAAGFLAYSIWQEVALQPQKPAPELAKAPPPVQPQPVPTVQPTAPVPQRYAPVARPVAAELFAEHGAGRAWRYSVTVEPALWRDATLLYRAVEQDGAKVVDTEFRYAGGQMKFRLGTFSAGHPSHANTRFPGFFMYAAYLDKPLEVGQRFVWEWPWQLPGGAVRAGRVKRYTGEVKESGATLPAPPAAKAPGDLFNTARIEGTLSYIEDGQVRASAAETLWYSTRHLQVVKVVREGSTPDEGAHRIVADLVEYQY